MVLRRQLQEADIKKFKGKKYLKLQKAGETDYNYTVRRMVLSIMIQRISRQSIL